MRRVAGLASVLALMLFPSLAQASHLDAPRLEQIRQAEVVVVTGSADHMEQVLRRAQVRFAVVTPDELAEVPLHGQQVLMVNCTGEMSAAARERVRRFVTAGGFLYTTDHAVHHLLERTFPGYLRFSGKTSTEEIFPMELGSADRGLLQKIGGAGHPRWQLASGGMLFDVVDPHKVDVLMRSREVAARYHTDGALGVRFRVGDGQVIHVTGHFYTQPGQRPEVASAGQAFEQLSANVVREKASDKARLDGLYTIAPRRSVVMQATPAPASPPIPQASGAAPVSTSRATRVRVLEKKSGMAHIRDEEGNEGWVAEDAL
jgi:hypothetical protein